MQRYTRFMGLFLCLIIFLCPAISAASEIIIDTSHASDGYFSVCYSAPGSQRIKVGITFGKDTAYYDYTAGDTLSYAFTQGDGKYTITVYENVKPTYYQVVSQKTINVKLNNKLAPYLASTYEIEFADDDIVGQTAHEICDGILNEKKKIATIYNYVKNNIVYDYNFAESVSNGIIKNYHPKASDTLKNKKGICYDYAVLFAAMCRSQAIPCDIRKGYYGGEYHAWDRVYYDGSWHDIDPTILQNNESLKR